MKLTLKRDLPLMLAVLLAIWCMWYARPIGVDTLFPGLEPDEISVFMNDFTEKANGGETRTLTCTAGTPEFDDLWARIQELKFRRPPLNVVMQALPFLDNVPVTRTGASTGREPELDMVQFFFAQDNGQEVWRTEMLSFWSNLWYYRDFDHGVTLPLVMRDGGEIGQELALSLWKQAEN